MAVLIDRSQGPVVDFDTTPVIKTSRLVINQGQCVTLTPEILEGLDSPQRYR